MAEKNTPEDIFIDEIEITVPRPSSLGEEAATLDTKKAEPHVSIGDVSWPRASIGGVFRHIEYCLYGKLPACHIIVEMTFKSTVNCRLETADLYCDVGSDVRASKKPSFAWIKPEQLSDPQPLVLAPNENPSVTAEGNLWLGVGNVKGEVRLGSPNHPRFAGWDMTGSVTSSKDTTDRAKAAWNYTANSFRDYGLSHSFVVEMMVLHSNQDFCIRFLFKGRVYRGYIGLFGGDGRRPVWCKRTFHPLEHSVID
jgi:hypothetical protein